MEYYRPSREPYLNSYVEKLRQDIKDETSAHRRFERNNLNQRERAALNRLSNNKDISQIICEIIHIRPASDK